MGKRAQAAVGADMYTEGGVKRDDTGSVWRPQKPSFLHTIASTDTPDTETQQRYSVTG